MRDPCKFSAGIYVPYSSGLVPTCSCEEFSVRADVNISDLGRVRHSLEVLPVGNTPHPSGPIHTPGY